MKRLQGLLLIGVGIASAYLLDMDITFTIAVLPFGIAALTGKTEER